MWTEYHRGLLATDRQKDSRLDSIARQAFDDAKAGKLVLTQKRHGRNDYSYLKRVVKR